MCFLNFDHLSRELKSILKSFSDALHSHIETTHLSSAPESSTQKTLEQFPPDEHNPVGSENVENPELNAMLIISDVNNIKVRIIDYFETLFIFVFANVRLCLV